MEPGHLILAAVVGLIAAAVLIFRLVANQRRFIFGFRISELDDRYTCGTSGEVFHRRPGEDYSLAEEDGVIRFEVPLATRRRNCRTLFYMDPDVYDYLPVNGQVVPASRLQVAKVSLWTKSTERTRWMYIFLGRPQEQQEYRLRFGVHLLRVAEKLFHERPDDETGLIAAMEKVDRLASWAEEFFRLIDNEAWCWAIAWRGVAHKHHPYWDVNRPFNIYSSRGSGADKEEYLRQVREASQAPISDLLAS